MGVGRRKHTYKSSSFGGKVEGSGPSTFVFPSRNSNEIGVLGSVGFGASGTFGALFLPIFSPQKCVQVAVTVICGFPQNTFANKPELVQKPLASLV